jgi:osmotically-inducible protein OsmY
MSPALMPEKASSEFSRCEEHSRLIDHGRSLTPGQKTDATLKATIERALWNDDVLRAIEAHEIEVNVKDSVVHLDGHIASMTNQKRVQNAIRVIPGLVGIHNNLVLDDRLTVEVAGSLGTLEHTYGCKFFTGASHGVVSLNGIVNHEGVKWLAEKCIAGHPNVRAVINNVQPLIGQLIYFLDGVSGIVRQVIINPNNRRVVAMILRGQVANQPRDSRSSSAQVRSPEHLIVVPMDHVRFMTQASGFLHINSNESKRYMDFDASHFSPPTNDWKAPYPYCPEDVLFPVEKRQVEYQLLEQLPRSPFVVTWAEQPLREELLANDSLGG